MTASICHKGVNIKNYSYRVKKMTAIFKTTVMPKTVDISSFITINDSYDS